MRTRIAALAIAILFVLPIAGRCVELNLNTPAPTPLSSAPQLSETALLDVPPISLNCASAILVEPESGQILFEMNADSPRAVASVTKLMTILLTLEAIDSGRISLEQQVVISKEAAGMGGSQVLLDVGETQSVSILLKSMIVGSANDAAVALAETLYGSEALCAAKMNERAESLGMTDTHFVNCTGLPAKGQHTTARDVARMSIAVFSHSLYYGYSQIWLDEVDHGDGRMTQLTNTNKLIRLLDGCDGGKTGSTKEAGFCLSATAKRSGMRLIAVVLGAPSGAERFDAAKEMLNYGFANYRLYPIAQRGAKVRGELPIIGGESDRLSLELGGDLTLIIQKGDEQNVLLTPRLPDAVEAPVEQGAEIGSVCVEIGGKTIATLPILAAESVHGKGLQTAIRRMIRNWAVCE